MDKVIRVELVRRYARNIHEEYTAKLENLRTVLAERPMELDGDHFVDFYGARALYSLYAEALSLDAVGNSAFSDDKVLDRIRDARASQLNWLITTRASNGGIYGLTQQIAENVARTFIHQTAIVATD